MQRKSDALYLKSYGEANSLSSSAEHLLTYEQYIFKNQKADIPLSEFVPDFTQDPMYNQNLILRYINTPADAEAEIEDIYQNYIKPISDYNKQLQDILMSKSILH